MKDSELFEQLESDVRLLQKISEQYQPTSGEFEALRRAALSLMYVVVNQRAEFRAFLKKMKSDLTDDQRRELRERFGIEV